MKESYKCSCCGCWGTKQEIDHISHSTGKDGTTQQYIECKRCKKSGCLGLCKRWDYLKKRR